MKDLPAVEPITPEQGEGHSLTGEFRLHREIRSRFVSSAHDALVYLPPDYQQDIDRRYPVLYLQDGQNLFDGATAFIPGQEWHVDEAAESLIRAGEIEPLIIVGVYNAGEARMDEYTPTVDKHQGQGGRADDYGKMLIEELKPLIDRQYRTIADAQHTGLGGSSLGGLLTIYLGLRRPDVFARLAVMSPSVWWDGRAILKTVSALPGKGSQRIWLDTGTAEGGQTAENARRLRDALLQKGWLEGEDLLYMEAEGAGHCESAWAARIDPMLRFLFPRCE